MSWIPSWSVRALQRRTNGDIKKDGKKSVDASPVEEDQAGTRARKTVCEGDDRPRDGRQQRHPTSRWTWLGYLLIVIVSKLTLPSDLRPTRPTTSHVWYYGWVTAVSTGLGAAPLFFAQNLGARVLSVGNAIAAGMMLSASYSLVEEGATVQESSHGVMGWWISTGVLSAPWVRVVFGVLLGLVFIISTKKVRGSSLWNLMVWDGTVQLTPCLGVLRYNFYGKGL